MYYQINLYNDIQQWDRNESIRAYLVLFSFKLDNLQAREHDNVIVDVKRRLGVARAYLFRAIISSHDKLFI